MKKVLRLASNIVPFTKSSRELSNLRKDRGILQLEKGNLEAEIRSLMSVINNHRNVLAHYFIKGKGIEIGAAQYPVALPAGAKVRYVDIFTADELRAAHPSAYANVVLVEIDVVDDAEQLTKFKKDSLDFIIANHFIEHCLNPIGTLISMYGKLKRNGILFFAIPDKRYTFDKNRGITNYEHLLEESRDKNKSYLHAHTVDFLKNGEVYKGKDFDAHVKRVIDSGYRIHYHVWTQREMTEMFIRIAGDFGLQLEIEAILKNGHEVIYILRKIG